MRQIWHCARMRVRVGVRVCAGRREKHNSLQSRADTRGNTTADTKNGPEPACLCGVSHPRTMVIDPGAGVREFRLFRDRFRCRRRARTPAACMRVFFLNSGGAARASQGAIKPNVIAAVCCCSRWNRALGVGCCFVGLFCGAVAVARCVPRILSRELCNWHAAVVGRVARCTTTLCC